ncbi:MAG: flavodoxin-dependent (E)-4-hydroxy-3-methylbut-2-enyl-diphosphate synthase [Clostridiaceae bacterium]|nr:flavodoxin-dependent (E)-4-hydroxy-3-methylbut-2-enyl-diphosphate synthase [Clostridiaceae bacterium]
MNRKITREIRVGDIHIGNGMPVVVQSMNSTNTLDIDGTLRQIRELHEAGCELTRVAIPNMDAAEALNSIVSASPIPVVADIHYDYRLALAAIENGAAKIRINPGNMKDDAAVAKVAAAARERHIPIRVGVNSGSIAPAVVDRFGGVNADSMVFSAINAIQLLERENFSDIIVSIKSSDPRLMIESYRLLSQQIDYPLHLGVTEAGTVKEGVIRSAVGIGTLLAEGIGDTIRVSLTGDPVDEVYAAYSILKSLGLRQKGVTLISCPTCGRTAVPLIEVANEIESRIKGLPYNIKVAVMGCAVNGPGEAREADVGIAGGDGEFLLFKKGKPIRKISKDNVIEELMTEIHLSGTESQNRGK